MLAGGTDILTCLLRKRPIGHHDLLTRLKVTQLHLSRIGFDLQLGNQLIFNFGRGLAKRDQTAHTNGGADRRPAL